MEPSIDRGRRSDFTTRNQSRNHTRSLFCINDMRILLHDGSQGTTTGPLYVLYRPSMCVCTEREKRRNGSTEIKRMCKLLWTDIFVPCRWCKLDHSLHRVVPSVQYGQYSRPVLTIYPVATGKGSLRRTRAEVVHRSRVKPPLEYALV